MVQELTHTLTGDVLRYKQAGLPSGLYRILIPAGSRAVGDAGEVGHDHL